MEKHEKDRIISELEFIAEHNPCQGKGGQQVSMAPRGVRVTHEELRVSIFVGYFRTQMENKAAAISLFETWLSSNF